MNILFILSLLSLAVFAAASILKKRRYSDLIRYISCGGTVIFAFAAGFGAHYLMPLCIGVAIFAVVSLGFSVAAEVIRSKSVSSFLGYMAKAMLVVLLLEAVVFNFNSYHLWRGGYEKTDLSLSGASISGMQMQGGKYVSTGDSATIEFTNVDRRIGVIRLDLSGTVYKTDYSIDFTDETNANYRIRSGLVRGSVFDEIDATKYVVCDFSGKVGKFRINLTELAGNRVTLKGVTLNADYPAAFSYMRFVMILLGVAFVWLFRRSANFRKPLGDQPRVAKAVTAVVIVCVVLISYILSSVNLDWSEDFSMDSGNQITQELVDALEDGQVELKAQPSQQLLDMENPYDWSERANSGVSALWDHVLYNGKYYSYYGIGPVILLYLPFHLLTGNYLASLVGVLLFNTLALIFLGMTVYKLMKKLFPDIPLSMYTAALMMIYAACGVWYCTVMANFYEIAQSSGFCFTILGAYCLAASNVIGGNGKERIRLIPAALSSLFLAIAVTCRPTTAVWCVVAAGFIAAGVVRLVKNKSPKSKLIKYLVCALTPFIVIGGAQMLYNYARFGSFTDFGIAYSLTINDFTHTEFHTQLAAIGFFDYLFAPPSFSGEFPYVQTTLSTLGVNGYYFVATNNGCGMLFRALPMFFLFASPFALKYVAKEKRLRTALLFIAAGIVAPCVIIFSIWESGYGVRYMMDFAWEMLICAFFVMFLFYRNLKSDESKRIYERFLLIALFACLFVNMALVYSYYYPGNYVGGSEAAFERFGRMFSIFNT